MIASYILALAVSVRDLFDGAFHLVAVVLGGLALWAIIIVARYIMNGCSFRGGGRGRRR